MPSRVRSPDIKKEDDRRRYNAGDSCNAMSLSPDQTHLAVGGRNVFKILSINDCEFDSLAQNLRTGRTNLTFSSNDVQWCPSMSFSVATAATNGKVVIWDVEKLGQSRQSRVLSDHSRAVNRVSWSPSDPILLSGSQDGSVKLWDIRVRDACQITFAGHCGPVRDVQWSHLNANVFASGLDTGLIQIWDFRKNLKPENELSAHQGLVMAIEWHCNERHVLASGGRDRQLKIWDLFNGVGSVPRHTISTTASIARIRWRPGFPSHVASSSTLFDNCIHIWDIHHPFIPIGSCSPHLDAVTGIQWFNNGEEIASCSKDSWVAVSSVSRADCAYERIRSSCMTWNADNNLAIVNNGFNKQEACLRRFISSPFTPIASSKSTEVKLQIMSAPSTTARDDLSVYDDPFLLERGFVHLAKNYKLTGSSIAELCGFNAIVASEVGRTDMVEVWGLIPLLISEIKVVESTSDARRMSSELYDVGDMFELMTDNDESMRSLMECMPSVRDLGPFSSKTLVEETMSDLLSDLSDRGDVQNCCAVVIVIGSKIRLDGGLVRRYLTSYIELLQRRKLWSCATEVILLSPDESVASMNQMETKVDINCSHCNEPIKKGQTICTICRRFNTCSLCRQRVVGLYVWCQACGHGGHPNHMQKWFTENVQCPTGCLHQCLPSLAAKK
uniref:Uncharacterized protein n=1 Tax=Spongospora subterranea TaxID=70186 RepID=A0A0H5QVX2_9EUKA|eukprot:CRZ05887.1 hypothetical protein [Spongospora subterranea]